MVADNNKSGSRRKKSLSYVDRLKLAKKNKKSKKRSRRYEEETDEPDSAVRTGETAPDPCDIPLSSPRRCASDAHAHSSTNASSASSFHSLSLRLEDSYSSKLGDGASDLEEPVRLSVNQSLFHETAPPGEPLTQSTVNESVRWELVLHDCPDDEKERLRVYKLNRRKRYLAKRHHDQRDLTTAESKMAQMTLTSSPRKGVK